MILATTTFCLPCYVKPRQFPVCRWVGHGREAANIITVNVQTCGPQQAVEPELCMCAKKDDNVPDRSMQFVDIGF